MLRGLNCNYTEQSRNNVQSDLESNKELLKGIWITVIQWY